MVYWVSRRGVGADEGERYLRIECIVTAVTLPPLMNSSILPAALKIAARKREYQPNVFLKPFLY